MPGGTEELTLQSLSPEQKGYRVFIDRLSWSILAANKLVQTKGIHVCGINCQDEEGGADLYMDRND